MNRGGLRQRIDPLQERALPAELLVAGKLALSTRRLRLLPGLAGFLPEFESFVPLSRGPADAVAGWGVKPTTKAARAKAADWGILYLALEDGFLRSMDLGVEGTPPLSLVVDPVGIYYDASRPSALELQLQHWREISAAELETARQLIDLMRRHSLGKYNGGLALSDEDRLGRERALVLVVDQTRDDASVLGGQADASTFAGMLEAALDENPGADVRVRVHPDVLAGRRQGYLLEAAARRKVPLETRAVAWPSLALRAERVYTATSQAGWEAIINGVPVECFGLPFYAGWGLSADRMSCPRRSERPSLEAAVASAYLRYCRYIHPATRQPANALVVARFLALCRERDARNAGTTVVLGVRPWRRWEYRSFLGSRHGRLHYARTARSALRLQARRGGRIAVWAAREPPGIAVAAAAQGALLRRIEDGFLRSVGLGSNHVTGLSLVIDDQGIYFDPAWPSALEMLLEAGDFPAEELARARILRTLLVDRALTKYNVGGTLEAMPSFPSGRHRILVPGQVEDDASVRLGSPAVRGNLALLQAVRAAAPEAFVLYKPHPDVEAGNRPGRVPPSVAMQYADEVVTQVSVTELFPLVDEIHTMTSLVGFEGLLRGLKVVTYGAPFYAGWGLTDDRLPLPRRQRRATLDELVATVLIRYPLYVDPLTRQPCPVEEVVAALADAGRVAAAGPSRWRRLGNLLTGLWRSL